jgi:hypothetical protein
MTLMMMAAMARMKAHSIGYESAGVNSEVAPRFWAKRVPGLR